MVTSVRFLHKYDKRNVLVLLELIDAEKCVSNDY